MSGNANTPLNLSTHVLFSANTHMQTVLLESPKINEIYKVRGFMGIWTQSDNCATLH